MAAAHSPAFPPRAPAAPGWNGPYLMACAFAAVAAALVLSAFAVALAGEIPLRSYYTYAGQMFLAMWGIISAAYAWRFYATAKPFDAGREPVFFLRRQVAALAPAVALIVQGYVTLRFLSSSRGGPPSSAGLFWLLIPLGAAPSFLESARIAAGRSTGRVKAAVTAFGLVVVSIAFLGGLSLLGSALANAGG